MSLKAWFERTFPPLENPYTANARFYAEKFLHDRERTKPHLAHVTRAPTRDEFERWRDDPVTEFVMAAVKRNSEEQREEWLRRSWDTGEADQDALIALRERADALEGFAADYEAFCETLNLEPNEGEDNA